MEPNSKEARWVAWKRSSFAEQLPEELVDVVRDSFVAGIEMENASLRRALHLMIDLEYRLEQGFGFSPQTSPLRSFQLDPAKESLITLIIVLRGILEQTQPNLMTSDDHTYDSANMVLAPAFEDFTIFFLPENQYNLQFMVKDPILKRYLHNEITIMLDRMWERPFSLHAPQDRLQAQYDFFSFKKKIQDGLDQTKMPNWDREWYQTVIDKYNDRSYPPPSYNPVPLGYI